MVEKNFKSAFMKKLLTVFQKLNANKLFIFIETMRTQKNYVAQKDYY